MGVHIYESSEGLSFTTIPNPRESYPVPARHSQAYKKVQKAVPPTEVPSLVYRRDKRKSHIHVQCYVYSTEYNMRTSMRAQPQVEQGHSIFLHIINYGSLLHWILLLGTNISMWKYKLHVLHQTITLLRWLTKAIYYCEYTLCYTPQLWCTCTHTLTTSGMSCTFYIAIKLLCWQMYTTAVMYMYSHTHHMFSLSIVFPHWDNRLELVPNNTISIQCRRLACRKIEWPCSTWGCALMLQCTHTLTTSAMSCGFIFSKCWLLRLALVKSKPQAVSPSWRRWPKWVRQWYCFSLTPSSLTGTTQASAKTCCDANKWMPSAGGWLYDTMIELAQSCFWPITNKNLIIIEE